MTAIYQALRGLRIFAGDVAEGFFAITHNGLALIGLMAVAVVATLTLRPDLRTQGEAQLLSWLQQRLPAISVPVPLPAQPEALQAVAVAEPEAVERATALHPNQLPREQAQVAYWISKKYNVAPEPVAALVAEAYESGGRTKIDPALILAVIAIESGFNPFAQSQVGAQGLMQVMTRVHTEKYEAFGGRLAAFDPISNVRVGTSILKTYIQQTGSLQAGLKYYVGAANLNTDGGYAEKVLAEYGRIYQVAQGKPLVLPAPPAARPAPEMVAKADAPVPAPAAVTPEVAVGALLSAPKAAGEARPALVSMATPAGNPMHAAELSPQAGQSASASLDEHAAAEKTSARL